MILSSGSTRRKAIEIIYGWSSLKENVQKYVLSNSGSEADALDVFHEGIIALDRNIRTGKFRKESTLEGYLFGICRYVWQNQRRKSQREILTDSLPDEKGDGDAEIRTMKMEERDILSKIVALLDGSCRKILSLWKKSFTMLEIAEALHLSSPEMAKKYKYRCNKKLKAELALNPHLIISLRNVYSRKED